MYVTCLSSHVFCVAGTYSRKGYNLGEGPCWGNTIKGEEGEEEGDNILRRKIYLEGFLIGCYNIFTRRGEVL